MASPSPAIPRVVSLPRITTLIASVLVALSSGTNYAFSGYAPQLGSRLHITHTRLNVIGLAGNVGVYSSGPLWGRIVDSRGPRYLLVGAFVFLLSGYSGIRYLYDIGLPPSTPASTPLSTFTFYALVACTYLTGAGGNGGLTSAVNATAKSFPDRARATTTGIVLSGFGLSAFFFSAISHAVFPGDTSAFLLLLSLGTALPMILGFFFVRPIPLPTSEALHTLEHGAVDAFGEAAAVDASAVIFAHANDSQAHLLAHDHLEQSALHQAEHSATPPNEYIPGAAGSIELSPSRDASPMPPRQRARGARGRRSLSRAAKILVDGLPDVSGKALFASGDFWLLFTILSLLSGTGLMYINNVGSMSQALVAKGNPTYDEGEASRWQAAQVSSISLLNFSGRIFIGLVADHAKMRLSLPRTYCLVLVALFFLTSQIVAARVEDIGDLWKASALLGLAHGSVFGVFPTLCIEWFGLPHFSENWGYLSMSPMFGGNMFSVAFGRNLDAHAPPATAAGSDAAQCLLGRECYVSTLHVTTAACGLAVILSVWAGWREGRRIAEQEAHAPGTGRIDVVWEDPEE